MKESLYSVRNLFNKQPVEISTSVKAILALLVVGGVIGWSAATVAAFILALEAVLGLFIKSKTVNLAELEEWNVALGQDGGNFGDQAAGVVEVEVHDGDSLSEIPEEEPERPLRSRSKRK